MGSLGKEDGKEKKRKMERVEKRDGKSRKGR